MAGSCAQLRTRLGPVIMAVTTPSRRHHCVNASCAVRSCLPPAVVGLNLLKWGILFKILLFDSTLVAILSYEGTG